MKKVVASVAIIALFLAAAVSTRADQLDDITRQLEEVKNTFNQINQANQNNQTPLAYVTLEASQFAVAAFIFCSAYLYFRKGEELSAGTMGRHLVKRVRRLIIPYYLFFAAYTAFTFFGEPKKNQPGLVFREPYHDGRDRL